MDSINTFSKGLSTDLSKLIIPKDKYHYALNMRPVTETGFSSLSLEGIRGNNYEIDIPGIWNVYKLKVTTTSTSAIATTITVMGSVTSSFSVTSSTTGLDLYNQLATLPLFNTNFFVAYDDTSVIIWATTESSTIDPSVTFTGLGISYVTNNNSPDIYLPAINSLQPIGSTFIRDDFYIFTCNNTYDNPGGHDPNLTVNPSQLGQIWKLSYDYSEPNSVNTTITLIYNNYIDFTTKHPIPPTATEGRYENNNTSRIYWSDNYNVVRSLNVSNTNAMILDPSLLDINPAIDFSIPLLNKVDQGGNILSGAYQCAYRLLNSGGATTSYSNLSNIVFIGGNGYGDTQALNPSQYHNYIGNSIGTTLNKTITWDIKDLDIDYDFIEVVILRREIKTDQPDIFTILQEPVPTDGTFTFTYTGNETELPITVEEFIANGNTFTHCKTMATKDNILFLGNIRNVISDLDYDARAYRFNFGKIAQLTDINGVSSNYSIGQIASISETADCINPNQSTYKYQSDGTTIGGEGVNIKYTFGTVLLPMDRFSNFSNVSAYSADADSGFLYQDSQTHSNAGANFGQVSQVLDLNVTYKDNSTLQEYPTNFMNISTKMSYIADLFRGYKRNEIYRFGIQFYDKKKNPYFVKWIGDIKMPTYNDTNNNALYLDGSSATATVTDFRPAVTKTSTDSLQLYCNQLFVQFEVNIPSNISSLVSGYSIVRVERKKDDMTIAGQGLLIPFESRGGTDLEIPGAIRDPLLYHNWGVGIGSPYGNIMCPDWVLDAGLYHGYGSTNDYIDCQTYDSVGTYDNAFGLSGGEAYYMQKLYDFTYRNIQYNVSDIQFFPKRGAINDGTNTFYNESTNGVSRTASDVQSIGNDSHYIKTTSNILFANASLGGSDNRKIIIDYYRYNVTSTQYGGQSYSNRSKNEYILCNHFKPINTDTSLQTETFNTFGGDTWVLPYDSQKLIKGWGLSGGNPLYSNTTYFPVETRVNLLMREGDYTSYNLLADDGTGASGDELNVYNNVYNNENDIVKYYPKPLLFNDIDEWDNRIVYSNIKINGETSDSWSKFPVNNYHDVEGSYGPINAILSLNEYELYYIQPRGFGKCLVNPTVVANTNADLPTVLGQGLTIQTSVYISTDCGTQHQWSVSKSNGSIVFVDTQKNRIYRYNGQLEPLTDVKGMKSFMNKEILYGITNNDTPLQDQGIITTYDYQNKEYLFTFLNVNTTPEYSKSTTLVFNEVTNEFTSFYSPTPQLYINNNRIYYTVRPNNKSSLYVHNKGDIGSFYGQNYPFKLKFVVNDNPSYTKVLDNLSWLTEVISDTSITNDESNINQFPETWNYIRIFNDYQNTDTVTLDPTNKYSLRRVERNWNLQCPRNKVLYSTSASPNIFTDLGSKTYNERMRDKTFTVELEYSNTNNYRFIMHLMKSTYRLSPR